MAPRPEQECIERAAAVFAAGLISITRMTPREQAEAAWTPSAPYASVDELEDEIRADRGLPPLTRVARRAS